MKRTRLISSLFCLLSILMVATGFCIPQVFAGSYDQVWWIYLTHDSQQRHFADIEVRYDLSDQAATGQPFNVHVSLEYLKNENAHYSWLQFYDVAVHIRSSGQGKDLASAIDHSRIRTVPGQSYGHTFSILTTQLGTFYIALTWTTYNPSAYAYGQSSDAGVISNWDTGRYPSNLPTLKVGIPGRLVINMQNAESGTINIDGQNMSFNNGRIEQTLNPATYHLIEVPPVLDTAPGTRSVFMNWNDGNVNNLRQVDLASGLDLTAEYKIQYYLNVISEQGDPKGSGWYDAKSVAQFSVTSPSGSLVRYVFQEWTGDYSGTNTSASVVMDGPKTVRTIWEPDYAGLAVIILALAAAGGIGTVVRRRRKARGHFETPRYYISVEPPASDRPDVSFSLDPEFRIYRDRLQEELLSGKIDEREFTRLITEFHAKRQTKR